jgi:hypothetical protein
LLANEDGPADFIFKLRARLGSGFWGKLTDCFHCLSFWVAAPMAFFVSRKPAALLLTWLALSGAACLLERLGQEPVVIQPAPQENKSEVKDGMLWRETSGDENRSAGKKPAASRTGGD